VHHRPVDTKMHEQRLEASVNALFRRWPMLCGFTIHHASELLVGEITIDPSCGPQPRGELCGEIVAVLGELIEECPEASELLRERTFARVFH
jgi:hypothetical protein